MNPPRALLIAPLILGLACPASSVNFMDRGIPPQAGPPPAFAMRQMLDTAGLEDALQSSISSVPPAEFPRPTQIGVSAIGVSATGFRFSAANLSYLNRHLPQVQWIRQHALPPIVARRKQEGSPWVMKIVVLGASVGDELVRVFHELVGFLEEAGEPVAVKPKDAGWRVEIVGIEKDEQAVKEGKLRLVGHPDHPFRWSSRANPQGAEAYSEQVWSTLNRYREIIATSIRYEQGDFTDLNWLGQFSDADLVLANFTLNQAPLADAQSVVRVLDTWESAWLATTGSAHLPSDARHQPLMWNTYDNDLPITYRFGIPPDARDAAGMKESPVQEEFRAQLRPAAGAEEREKQLAGRSSLVAGEPQALRATSNQQLATGLSAAGAEEEEAEEALMAFAHQQLGSSLSDADRRKVLGHAPILEVVQHHFGSEGLRGKVGIELGLVQDTLLLFEYLESRGVQMTGVGDEAPQDGSKRFVRGDITAYLGRVQQPVDFIYARQVMTYAARPGRQTKADLLTIYQAIARVLKPDGLFVALDDPQELGETLAPTGDELRAIGFEVLIDEWRTLSGQPTEELESATHRVLVLRKPRAAVAVPRGDTAGAEERQKQVAGRWWLVPGGLQTPAMSGQLPVTDLRTAGAEEGGQAVEFGKPGYRHLGSQSSNDYLSRGGWKLHLAVKPENYEAVDRWLFDHHSGQYKLLTGGDPGETDFTIYVGSRDAAETLARTIAFQIGHLLEPADNSTDRMFARNVSGRFDVSHTRAGRRLGLIYYGRGGIPFDEAASMENAFGGSQGPGVLNGHVQRIRGVLEETYGTYFTGSPSWEPRQRAGMEELPAGVTMSRALYWVRDVPAPGDADGDTWHYVSNVSFKERIVPDRFRVYINPKPEALDKVVDIATRVLARSDAPDATFKYRPEGSPGRTIPGATKLVFYLATAEDAVRLVRILQPHPSYADLGPSKAFMDTLPLDNITMVSGGTREAIARKDPKAVRRLIEIAQTFRGAGIRLHDGRSSTGWVIPADPDRLAGLAPPAGAEEREKQLAGRSLLVAGEPQALRATSNQQLATGLSAAGAEELMVLGPRKERRPYSVPVIAAALANGWVHISARGEYDVRRVRPRHADGPFGWLEALKEAYGWARQLKNPSGLTPVYNRPAIDRFEVLFYPLIVAVAYVRGDVRTDRDLPAQDGYALLDQNPPTCFYLNSSPSRPAIFKDVERPGMYDLAHCLQLVQKDYEKQQPAQPPSPAGAEEREKQLAGRSSLVAGEIHVVRDVTMARDVAVAALRGMFDAAPGTVGTQMLVIDDQRLPEVADLIPLAVRWGWAVAVVSDTPQADALRELLDRILPPKGTYAIGRAVAVDSAQEAIESRSHLMQLLGLREDELPRAVAQVLDATNDYLRQAA